VNLIAQTALVLMTADLPMGSAPAALEFPHFPSRIHAFVWRNYELVPLAGMAEVLGTSEVRVRETARAMGLPDPPGITDDQWRRSYITIIRRNWHLLPYDQLLTLLGWTADQLAFTLREDDFLFIKLGSLKPRCEPLRYTEPDARVREREAWFRETIHTLFPDGLAPHGEPLFEFVRELSSPVSAPTRPRVGERFEPRYCHSYFAPYGDPLLDPTLDPYPDGYLARLAECGADGVWLQAVLYKLAPFPWDPALSEGWETRLTNLGHLVQRARGRGIGVYLYLNEPRAMPLSFFEAHPDLKGTVEGDHAALCTSTPEVRAFIADALATIFERVPNLAGVFSITASENFTNCWSHGQGAGCPRCGQRDAAEVLAEVQQTFVQGVRRSSASARIIAWDWGWQEAWVPGIIDRLPADVTLQSVSEWDLPISRGGIESTVGEYSISSVGPGPRAIRHWGLAQARGLHTIAKIQAGTTWENGAVPYIPAEYLVAQHVANLANQGVDGIMLGWTLGGYPSPNLEVVSEVNSMLQPDPDRAVERVARRQFGDQAPVVMEAWRTFSEAFTEFPFHGGLVYASPVNFGPMNLLFAAPTGYRATMVGLPYDDLDGWRAVYPPDVYIGQFEKVVAGFEKGVRLLREAARNASGADARALTREASVAEATALHYRSCANQARFVLDRANPAGSRDEIRGVLEDEIEAAQRLYALQRADSRIGFESSNHYYYVPLDLAEKAMNCRDLLDHWLPGAAGR